MVNHATKTHSLTIDKAIHLWGEPSQVAAAKDLLQRLIAKCNSWSQNNKKKIEWAKIHAHSGRKDATVELKEKRDVMLQQLRKEPDSFSGLPEKVCVLVSSSRPNSNY